MAAETAADAAITTITTAAADAEQIVGKSGQRDAVPIFLQIFTLKTGYFLDISLAICYNKIV